MSRTRKKNILAVWLIIALLLLAMLLPFLPLGDSLSRRSLLFRSGIHICLLIAWGLFLHRRIIQIQIRNYLLLIVALMAFWILLKTIKHAISIPDLQRLLWYLYYIPMLFIPLIALFVSMSLTRAENYRLPRQTKLLYLPSLLLFALVITNDLHQLIFSFPSGVKSDQNYHHEIGYYIILVWVLLCALTAFVIMLRKCRIPNSRSALCLPLLPLALSFAYTLAYIRGVRWLLLLAGDMTVVHCLLIFTIFEGCVQCGLIQSNMGYEALFEATSLPAQITDSDFSTLHSSSAMKEPLSQEKLQKMKKDSLLLDENTLLKKHSLQQGWIFWTEDISELNQLQKELELTRDELRDTGDLLAAENAQQARLLRLLEENRLYDMMESQTAHQISLLRELLAKLQKTEDSDYARHLLGQIIVIGTYVKRRNNLIFVAAQRGLISSQELRLCLNESAENLNLYGISCRVLIIGEEALRMEEATLIYDLFEAVLETGLDSLRSILFSIETGENIQINLCASCPASLASLKERFTGITWELDEDGLQYISMTLKKKEKPEEDKLSSVFSPKEIKKG